MRYELLFQPPVDATFDDAAWQLAITKRETTTRPDGVLLWKLGSDDAELSAVVEGGKTVAWALRLALTADPKFVQRMLAAALELAADARLTLFDPQLAKVCTPAIDSLIIDEFLKVARYAGLYTGDAAAMTFTVGAAADPNAMTNTTRVFLAVLVFAMTLFATWIVVSSM